MVGRENFVYFVVFLGSVGVVVFGGNVELFVGLYEILSDVVIFGIKDCEVELVVMNVVVGGFGKLFCCRVEVWSVECVCCEENSEVMYGVDVVGFCCC